MAVLALAGSIQLVPDGTLLFHLVLIILMVALLNATLLKPINRILEERERRTKGRLSEAEATLVTVDAKLRDYEARLKEARAEGYAQMERERAGLSADRQRRVAETKAEIERVLSAEKQTLVMETEAAQGKLGAEARANALEISRQILGRSVSG